MKCKAFDAFLKELNHNPSKAKVYLQDKRITLIERKIIEGYLLLRDSRFEDAVTLLNELPVSPIDFVRAHRDHVLGIAQIMLTDFSMAISHLEKSIKLFDELDLTYYRFMSRFNLFMAQSNVLNLEAMERLLKEMDALPLESELEATRLLRCKYMLAEDQDDDQKAERLIHDLMAKKPGMSENDRYAQLVLEYAFFTKRDRFSEALETIQEMRKFRKYAQSENFNFMKKLLEHYVNNTPLYAYEQDFRESPRLFHQVMLIQALESQDIPSATKHWSFLKKAEPLNFGEAFEYKGAKSIFSLCLEKHTSVKASSLKVLPDQGQSKTDLMLQVFAEATAPIQKHQLYELVWGHPPETKDDILKMAKLVSYVRTKADFDIQTRKGTYHVLREQKSKKKVS